MGAGRPVIVTWFQRQVGDPKRLFDTGSWYDCKGRYLLEPPPVGLVGVLGFYDQALEEKGDATMNKASQIVPVCPVHLAKVNTQRARCDECEATGLNQPDFFLLAAENPHRGGVLEVAHALTDLTR